MQLVEVVEKLPWHIQGNVVSILRYSLLNVSMTRNLAIRNPFGRTRCPAVLNIQITQRVTSS